MIAAPSEVAGLDVLGVQVPSAVVQSRNKRPDHVTLFRIYRSLSYYCSVTKY